MSFLLLIVALSNNNCQSKLTWEDFFFNICHCCCDNIRLGFENWAPHHKSVGFWFSRRKVLAQNNCQIGSCSEFGSGLLFCWSGSFLNSCWWWSQLNSGAHWHVLGELHSSECRSNGFQPLSVEWKWSSASGATEHRHLLNLMRLVTKTTRSSLLLIINYKLCFEICVEVCRGPATRPQTEDETHWSTIRWSDIQCTS